MSKLSAFILLDRSTSMLGSKWENAASSVGYAKGTAIDTSAVKETLGKI